MKIAPTTCGNANQKGNVSFYFKGGCRGGIDIDDAYRCTGCGGWFHRDCIFAHFEAEEGCDVARNALIRIRAYAAQLNIIDEARVLELCKQGLDRTRFPKFSPPFSI